MLQSFKELVAWQKAYDLCQCVYRLSNTLSADERRGLVMQMRRAAVSVPSNIAEGYNRGTTKDYVRFLHTASGSLAELETQLMLSRDLRLVPPVEVDRVLDSVTEVGRLLKALIRSLREKMRASHPDA
jgi:four helix bundle protein